MHYDDNDSIRSYGHGEPWATVFCRVVPRLFDGHQSDHAMVPGHGKPRTW